MAPRYQHSSSIDAILEASEEERNGELRGSDRGMDRGMISENKTRREDLSNNTTMATTRTSGGKPKDKSKRSHRSAISSSRHSTKNKSKSNSSKRYSTSAEESQSLVRQHHRHRRNERRGDSLSSSSDEQDVDHRAVLAAARGRLTSPSLISTMTSLTTATNNSGGSSGSNSTITQASMSRSSKEVTITGTLLDDGPMSPAVPDPPNVFAYLEEEDSSSDDENEGPQYDENDEEHEENRHDDEENQEYDEDDDEDDEAADVVYNDIHPQSAWLSHPLSDDATTPLAPQFMTSSTPSISSASSSFHSDNSSEHAADNDTDRSSSPERSVKGAPSPPSRSATLSPHSPTESSPDPGAAKLAAQMLAAQHRQNLHSNHGPPHIPIPRSPAMYPPSHPGMQALSPRLPGHMTPRSFPHQDLPITGYEAVASALSPAASTSTATLPPIYRRFSALNHRLLLHMQDELCELETQLHALDQSDTAARTHPTSTSSALKIRPASRRASAAVGGEMEWRKIELLNRVSLKLNQYNETLQSFRGTAGMQGAEAEEVDTYRRYLEEKRPIVENETRFLHRLDDLVTLLPRQKPEEAVLPPATPAMEEQKVNLDVKIHRQRQPETEGTTQTLILAVAASVLVPILTFTVIPNFIGRMAVALVVAVGLLGIVMQAGGGVEMDGRERAVCAGIWAVGIAVVALVVA